MDCNEFLNKHLWCPEDETLMALVISLLFLYCQREFKCVSSFSSGPTLLFTREETFAGGHSICSCCLWFLTRSIKRSAPGVGKLEQNSVTSVRPTDAFQKALFILLQNSRDLILDKSLQIESNGCFNAASVQHSHVSCRFYIVLWADVDAHAADYSDVQVDFL